ncbi:MAG: TIGR03545 family protein [Pirellulaceae bacterium]|nr:TIGR03545 family protein [Pirellulaceae bacterium]
MIRWRYIITRLLIVVVVLMLVRWGLGPVASYVTAYGLEQATGAKVEIARSEVGLFPPRIQYTDFRVADPRSDKEMRDAFRAESIDLVIDGKSLLHRRWIASEGHITGLQIGTQRDSSGHLVDEHRAAPTADESAGMLGKFLRGATDQLEDHAESVIGGLETVRRSQEIRTRWETEYDSLVVRARALEQQIREIRDTARGIDNPLRDWEQLDRTLARATTTRNELQVVRETIDSLPQRLQDDIAALEQAKQVDLDKIDQYVPGAMSQSDNFGVDLMANAVRDQVQRIRGYLQGGRAIADYTMVAPESQRARGVDYDLLGLKRRPEIMVRHCEVGGMLSADGKDYVLTGVVENLTPTPELLAEPTQARLRLEGPDVVRIEIVRDRRQGVDVDVLTLHWPQTDADAMKLGNPNDARITIEGGQRELWVQLRTEGENISGRLVSKQSGLKMHLQVDPRYAQSPAAVALGQSLAAVDNIEVDATFDGTWRDLDLQLNSNLGQIFQSAARDAVAGQIQTSKRKLAVKVEETHLRESVALRKWLDSRQTEAKTLLASADASIKEMRDKVVNEVGQADAYLGKLRSAIEGQLR